MLAFNELAGSSILSLSVMTLTLTAPDLFSITPYQLSASPLSVPSTEGIIELVAIDENIIGMVYLTTSWGFSESAQIAELYFDGASPKLSLGERQSFSYTSAQRIACARIDGASVQSFSCSYSEELGFASTSFNSKSIIVRTCPATNVLNGRCVRLVHQRGNRPVGIATTAAAAGDHVEFLTRGDYDDASMFQFNHKGDVCLHCDGTVRASSTPEDHFSCTPQCACSTVGGSSINCRDIYTANQHSFGV